MDEKRDIRINFMVSKAEKDLIYTLAEKANTTVSNLLRQGVKRLIEDATSK